ncbi:3-hydroxyacyl-CoA dehydrogenase family protein [Chitinophaga pinensis]|uniref:3-hydroxyacyl-CoA dehydrogenase domain protein n=1 Tax=Chitinophaga pinensis (strain ATCC 43595 / DSM 2588 / LMG 13176 / NBRC 15968 / NCIMB 11800 / UQM 2034) TaxID=485918 RepID=A0A979G0H3_CHIPD|nr:3-hydroxyacyl-CoA dehydrogenase family protein [Chitinophaga pinensis]ACU58441.1 3-hydroxyacyl-CoA dehydrogenase domain protein [Chitinophaga pinensis DSM 2588]
MNILVIGEEPHYAAFLEKGGLNGHRVQQVISLERTGSLADYELVIDLNFDEHTERAGVYARFPQVPVLANIVRTSLSALMNDYAFEQGFSIIGCNWLPGFLTMSVMELSVMDDAQTTSMRNIMTVLGWEYEIVEDRVGLVTPRVICMIINEAYMAAQEGTASREDINTAMRLGTNYPMGPFEWCDKIGIRHVCGVLDAVYRATGNERYKISALLAREAGMDVAVM